MSLELGLGGLQDPVRAELLDMLAHDSMSVAEMTQALADRGLAKAPTTVRHHLDVLHEAGLIALKRLEENRGGVVKYYAATTRLLDFEAPAGFDEALGDALAVTQADLGSLLDRLRVEHGDQIRGVARSLKTVRVLPDRPLRGVRARPLLERAIASALRGVDGPEG